MIDNLLSKNKLESNSFWLLAIAGALIALHQNLIYKQSGSISIENLIFWGAALLIAWRRRDVLSLDSDFLSTCIGMTLIAFVLLRSILYDGSPDIIIYMTPFFSTVGLCLIGGGITKIKQFWREIIIVGMTTCREDIIFAIGFITKFMSILDAKICGYLLWYFGFNVSQTENFVIFSTGAIEVNKNCSSIGILWFLWQLCVLVFLSLDIQQRQKVLLFLGATFIGLFVNGLRLCLLALLVANKNQVAFDYWHGSSGAEIFSTLAILIFGLSYHLMTRKTAK